MSSQSINFVTWTRRQFLKLLLASGSVAASSISLPAEGRASAVQSHVFVGKVPDYDLNLRMVIERGLRELGVSAKEVKGKKILLKPNLVETHRANAHINTHPLVVRAAIEAFLSLGARQVIVGEGPGHRRDVFQILEESGLGPILQEDHIPFIDLNEQTGYALRNQGQRTSLATLTFPQIFRDVDWIVSMPKLKTHHWAGVTLSMKNLFGVLPGLYYGWPKNVLHQEGIHESILDINATLTPHFAIVDGVIGMEGDGPIMGTPKSMGVLVMGRNLPAVDATCARLMGIDPLHVPYLNASENWLGPISEITIRQRGEPLQALRQNFSLLDHIPAHRNLRLS